MTTSEKIGTLLREGKSRTEVARELSVNYGWVQNIYFQIFPDRVKPKRINRRYGIEIEAFGVDRVRLNSKLNNEGVQCQVESYNHTTRDHWKITSDGSINGTEAFEIVSPVLEKKKGLEQLKKVSDVLKSQGARINKTCGVHIHVEVNDLKIEDWKRLLKNYFRLEKIIDGFMPNSRRGSNNGYCKSLMNIRNFENRIDNETTLDGLQSIFNHDRYYKINLRSYVRQGTIEFRQHSGTIEFEKISNWVYFIERLIEFSKRGNTVNAEPTFDDLKNFLNKQQLTFYKRRTEELAA